MRNYNRKSLLFLGIITTGLLQLFWSTPLQAQSSYFTSAGCVNCHSAPVVASCNGCHAHGTHATSSKGTINLTGTTNKTTYAPGETVSVTIAGGYRSGWVRAVLYDQNMMELARSNGNTSGMGSATTLPAILSAPAPTTAGTYSWKVAWYGNKYDTASATFGPNWTLDPYNPNHGQEVVNSNSFTVAAPTDTTLPVVNVFTLPATSSSLTIPVSSFTASDNVGVTGYQITTTATAPTSWSATAPGSVTAPAAGSVTFYAWAKDAAGNVSLSRSASVTITLPAATDTTLPVVNVFTLPATSSSLTIPVSSFTASDNVGVTGYQITTTATAPTSWSVTTPGSVTAPAAGSVTFYAWAKDAAGNVSLSRSASVTITLPAATDTTRPVVSVFTLPATSSSLTIPVSSFTASDNVGVTGYQVTTTATAPTSWSVTAPGSVSAPAAGSVTFYAWAKDAAGNISLSKNAAVTITLPATTDTTRPVVSVFTLPATSSSLTIPVSSFTASDNVGVTGYQVNRSSKTPLASSAAWTGVKPISVTATTAGYLTFYAWAKDAAGNVSLAKKARVRVSAASVDTTKPALTLSTLANGSYTNNATLNVSGKASDARGLKSVTVNGQTVTVNADGTFTVALTLQIGSNAINVIATDSAGNKTVNSRTINYDPTAPIIAITSPTDNSTTTKTFITVNGTVNEASTVTVKNNNDTLQYASLSGNAFSAGVYLIQGINTINISAVDPAGNTSNAKRTITCYLDKPTLEVTSPNQDITIDSDKLTLRGTVTSTQGTVTVQIIMDGKSYNPAVVNGTFTQELNLESDKQYAISVTAIDVAGNKTTIVRNVIHIDDNDDNEDGTTTTSHPFGWTNPRSSHQDYVENNGVSVCVSCHSIDSASTGQAMSCYNCHDKKW